MKELFQFLQQMPASEAIKALERIIIGLVTAYGLTAFAVVLIVIATR